MKHIKTWQERVAHLDKPTDFAERSAAIQEAAELRQALLAASAPAVPGAFYAEIDRIAGDYSPSTAGEAILALGEMREAIHAALSNFDAAPAVPVDAQASFVPYYEGVEICQKCKATRAALQAAPAADSQAASVANGAALTRAAVDVLAERQRQIEVEGKSPDDDATFNDQGQMSYAAAGLAIEASYAATDIECGLSGDLTYSDVCTGAPEQWPHGWLYKPATPRRNLVKAAALILAEIERIDFITADQSVESRT